VAEVSSESDATACQSEPSADSEVKELLYEDMWAVVLAAMWGALTGGHSTIPEQNLACFKIERGTCTMLPMDAFAVTANKRTAERP
jgi:hypothetical protein